MFQLRLGRYFGNQTNLRFVLTSQIDLKARARSICSPSEFTILIHSRSLVFHVFSSFIFGSLTRTGLLEDGILANNMWLLSSPLFFWFMNGDNATRSARFTISTLRLWLIHTMARRFTHAPGKWRFSHNYEYNRLSFSRLEVLTVAITDETARQEDEALSVRVRVFELPDLPTVRPWCLSSISSKKSSYLFNHMQQSKIPKGTFSIFERRFAQYQASKLNK